MTDSHLYRWGSCSLSSSYFTFMHYRFWCFFGGEWGEGWGGGPFAIWVHSTHEALCSEKSENIDANPGLQKREMGSLASLSLYSSAPTRSFLPATCSLRSCSEHCTTPVYRMRPPVDGSRDSQYPEVKCLPQSLGCLLSAKVIKRAREIQKWVCASQMQ